MYDYEWINSSNIFKLIPQKPSALLGSLRPVFQEELAAANLDKHFSWAADTDLPLLWAEHNRYFLNGQEIGRFAPVRYKAPLEFAFNEFGEALIQSGPALKPVNLAIMGQANQELFAALVHDALRAIKELYAEYSKKTDIIYIAFSGGKDSMVLLDLCHQALPVEVPVVFSDTDMELPSTYAIWEQCLARYGERPLIAARSHLRARDSWAMFGPPARSLRWCCAVHKNTPALHALKQICGKNHVRAAAFLGVRADESARRSGYDMVGEGVKSPSQVNLMPLLNWSSHEIWLYTLLKNLPINHGYKQGFARIGCLLCPESSTRYLWNVEHFYEDVMAPLVAQVIDSSNKNFESASDAEDFIGSQNWQARKSGAALNFSLKRPTYSEEDLKCVFSLERSKFNDLCEWLKTIGYFKKTDRDTNELFFKHDKTTIRFSLPNNEVSFWFSSREAKKNLLPAIRKAMHKAIACRGCGICAEACPNGALNFAKDLSIRVDDQCSHCMRCHFPNLGCWRFDSLVIPDTSKDSFTGTNIYKNFGCRSQFLETYLAFRDTFADREANRALNQDKQVPAAKAWFRQALLMEPRGVAPTRLLNLFSGPDGLSNPANWQLVWIALANNAPLIKLFVTLLKPGQVYDCAQMEESLTPVLGEKSRKGALSALKDTFRGSPLGLQTADVNALASGNPQGNPVAYSLVGKSSRLDQIVRAPIAPEPLVILYSLYLIAEKAGRQHFTVRELLGAELESAYVSPLVAFGLSAEEFIKACRGLSVRWPDFISCNFTLNLDEVNLNTEERSRLDVIGLMEQAYGGRDAV